MKKVIIGLAVGALGFIALAPAVSATENDNGWHLKTDICHNGTIVPVSINAVKTVQDTGHGLLVLDSDEDVVSFVAHVEGNGHATDSILRVYWKKGNNEQNTWVSPTGCAGGTGPEGPAGPQGPEGPQGPKGDSGPPGPSGANGRDGHDGQDGLTPIILCFPGAGLGYVWEIDEEIGLPDGSFTLGVGAICPLNGEDGTDGAEGPAGPAGPAGKDGAAGATGATGADGKEGPAGKDGLAGEAGPQGPAGSQGESVSGTTTTTAPAGQPVGELPHTGNGWLWIVGLAVLGAGIAAYVLRGLIGLDNEEEV